MRFAYMNREYLNPAAKSNMKWLGDLVPSYCT